MTILIVDDDPSWLKIASKVFSSLKFRVFAVSTYAEAMKAARAHRPDCIVLDCSMADGTPSGFCAALKTEEKLKAVPVVVVSGSQENGEGCGGDAFVLKGMPFSEITGAVDRLLKEKRI